MNNNLKSFFSTNSRMQEKFAEYLFLKDLLLQAACHQKTVAVSRSDFDAFGFDILLKYDDEFYPLQLKATNGKAAIWDVHKSIISGNGRVVLVKMDFTETTYTSKYLMFDPINCQSAIARPPKVSHSEKCMLRLGEFKDVTENLLTIF